jgi:hypothetical protein
MMELHEIEELIKNVNRNAIKALLRNAAIMKDPAATPEMKAQAEANVKAISYNKPLPKPKAEPKPRKQKAAAAEQATQLVKPSPAQTPVAAAPSKIAPVKSSGLPYHPDYGTHYGVTEEQWKAADPSAHHELAAHHNAAMAAVKQPAAPQPLKVAKSVDSLYNLFSELRKHL